MVALLDTDDDDLDEDEIEDGIELAEELTEELGTDDVVAPQAAPVTCGTSALALPLLP